MTTKNFDVIILGAGPAGLTAGIYLSRAKQNVVIIDEGTIGGQVIMSHLVANYPGQEEVPGYKLAAAMKKQAKQFGCTIKSNISITAMDFENKIKRIELEDDSVFEAPAIILAVGGSPRMLGVESEDTFKGSGISYCATCDGDFFQDQDIIVVGGGNSALEEAVSLTAYARSVKVIHQFDHFQAYPSAIKEAEQNNKIEFIMETVVEKFGGNGSLQDIILKNVKTGDTTKIDATGAFIFIGYIPNTDGFKDFLELSENGEILTDENLKTNLEGVYAAGDVRKKKIRQITTAVADGTIAATSAIEYNNLQSSL